MAQRRKPIMASKDDLMALMDHLATTPYGLRFLHLAHRNFSSTERLGHKPLKDVPGILRKYKSGPGQLFIPVSHRAFWLNAEQRQRIGPWIDALEQIDKNDNKAPLLDLLRSKRELPDEARVFLADLLERYQLTRAAHRPRTPAYDLSNSESRLSLAKEVVRAYRTNGKSFKDAVKAAAKEHSIDENTLANFCNERRGSSRRRKKRHPPLSR
jgi:hypothetical protein